VWCGHWGVYNSTQVWYSDDGGQTCEMVALSRFVALSVSLTRKASPFPDTLSETVYDFMDECTLAELTDGRCAPQCPLLFPPACLLTRNACAAEQGVPEHAQQSSHGLPLPGVRDLGHWRRKLRPLRLRCSTALASVPGYAV